MPFEIKCAAEGDLVAMEVCFSLDNKRTWSSIDMEIHENLYVGTLPAMPKGLIVIYFFRGTTSKGEKVIENNNGNNYKMVTGEIVQFPDLHLEQSRSTKSNTLYKKNQPNPNQQTYIPESSSPISSDNTPANSIQFQPFTTYKSSSFDDMKINNQIDTFKIPTLQDPPGTDFADTFVQREIPEIKQIGSNTFSLTPKKDFREAQKECLQVLQEYPDNAKAMLFLGRIYQYYYNLHDAIEIHKRNLAFHPNNPIILNNLALVYAEDFNFIQAEECLVKAQKLDPNLPAILANFGFTYDRWGKWDLAEKYYREYLRIKPSDKEIQTLLTKLLNKKTNS